MDGKILLQHGAVLTEPLRILPNTFSEFGDVVLSTAAGDSLACKCNPDPEGRYTNSQKALTATTSTLVMAPQ